MKGETAIGAQLAAKGITARRVALDMALAQYQNNGGSFGEALERVCAAFGADEEATKAMLAYAAQQFERDEAGRFKPFSGKGSEGRAALANSQEISADASRINGGEKGHPTRADRAIAHVPSSPSPRNGVDHTIRAKTAFENRSRSVPGHAKRGMAAIASVQAAMSKSLFDTTKLPDGRTLREVRWNECPNLALRYRRSSRILMAIYNMQVPVNQDATLDELTTEDGLKEIISTVERFNDIH